MAHFGFNHAPAGAERVLPVWFKSAKRRCSCIDLSSCNADWPQAVGQRGDYDKARELYENALAISKELGNMAEIGKCYEVMAEIARKRAEVQQQR